MSFNNKLVLNKYLLSLFGVKTFEELAKDFKEERLENHDENINRFTKELNRDSKLFFRGEENQN